MSPVSKPKRNQHFVPRLYLKGFAEIEGSMFVWEYDKNKPFNQANRKAAINPYRKSISKAGSALDMYAVRKDGVVVDFDTYENKMQALEDLSTPIFAKIRRYLNHNMPTKAEKLTFARYILLMLKRVPSQQKKRAEFLWPSVVNQIESRLTKWLDDYAAQTDLNNPDKKAMYERRKKEVANAIEQSRKGIPDEIRLQAIVGESDLNFPTMLANMAWQFWIARSSEDFFTSDNPVFYFEDLGINKPISELTFPVSRKVCLVASWRNVQEGYFPATASQVLTINERTAQRADRYLYATSCSKASYELMLARADNPNVLKLLYEPFTVFRNVPLVR